MDRVKELMEESGIDSRFIKKIGLYYTLEGDTTKQSIKVYIPKHDLELYQVMGIFFKIQGISISGWLRKSLKDYAKELKEKDDPFFQQAKLLHKEIKENQYLKMLENTQKE